MKPAYHIPLTENQLSIVGEISLIFSQIDHLLTSILNVIVDKKMYWRTDIFGSYNIGKKIELIKSISYAKEIKNAHQNKIDRMCKEIQLLSIKRNDIIHSIIGYSYDGIGRGYVLRRNTPGGSRMDYIGIEKSPLPLPGEEQPERPVEFEPHAFKISNTKKRNNVQELKAIRDELAIASRRTGNLLESLMDRPLDHNTWRDNSW